jgi:AraC-like DNA-binding protein
MKRSMIPFSLGMLMVLSMATTALAMPLMRQNATKQIRDTLTLHAQATPNAAWVARHGLTSEQYQTLFDQLVPNGYRLVDRSVYNINGQIRHAAIFERASGSAWQARFGLTGSQYQTLFDDLVGQGYRLVDVDGYSQNNQARYAAIFERASGSAWQARHGLTSQQYQQTFDQLANSGYRLVERSIYTVNGQPRHAAIFERASGSAWQARFGLTASQLQTLFDDLVGQGYRLIDIDGYTDNGQTRYGAIFVRESGPTWQARFGLTSQQYQQTFDRLVAEGYRPIKVHGYEVNGQARYAAIWERS